MRSSGILLHPSSLPHHGPCGDLGAGAIQFLDWLHKAGVGLWQTLPLHPPGAGFSPYSSHSAFAGAVYLCSLQQLVEEGLLTHDETIPPAHDERIVLDVIQNWKIPLIYKAAKNLIQQNKKDVEEWISTQHWAEDWSLFCALQKKYDVHGWQNFPKDLAERKTKALKKARKELSEEMKLEQAAQYLFFKQWNRIKKAAADRNIKIVGDMPIFVAADGCDAWTHRHLFRWDKNGNADPLAGAPPDAFSDMGQHWGNPLYNWKEHKKENFAWWIRRIRAELELSDFVRIDHFRGFCAAWEIPRSANGDARKGAWGPSPGRELFEALQNEWPELPFVAEDLGVITPDVDALRIDFSLMGMKVLQFAFGSYEHMYLPHNFDSPNWACYTGTHDNDTILGWYQHTSGDEQHRFRVYTSSDGHRANWEMIRSAWGSTAKWAITTMQDVLGQSSEGRMNVPGEGGGNWSWRAHELPEGSAHHLRSINETFGRLPKKDHHK